MMSYSALSRGLGLADVGPCPLFGSPSSDYCPFYQVSWQTDEVYVYRCTIAPAIVDTPTKALQIVEAYTASLLLNDYQDVRGVVVSSIVPGITNVEIVVTASSAGVPVLKKTESGVAEVMSDKLRAAWANPASVVFGGQYLQLLNKGAVIDWLAAPVIWSVQLKQASGSGKTAAFGAGLGVWKGGNAAHPQARMLPLEVPPIGPGSGPGPGTVPGGGTQASATTVLGFAAAGLALYAISKKRKRS